FRGRLGFAALGSGLLAATFILVGIGQVVPDFAGFTTDILPMFIAGAFYLAFVPPHWLRRAWQLPELQRFLETLAHASPTDRLRSAGEELCWSTTRLTGGTASAILRWDAGQQSLITDVTDNPNLADRAYGPNEGVAGSAWRDRAPVLATDAAEFAEGERQAAAALDSRALLAVPITGTDRTWGVLMAFRPQGRLFSLDLLELMGLLAVQYAAVLDNRELLREQEQLVVDLQRTNDEMEAFSYSVSHDLRRPLRGIDGFSEVLLQRYGDRLDAQGVDYLNRVRLAAQSMGSLIEDLLKLTQLSREDIRSQRLDLSVIARSIAEDLRRTGPERGVNFVIPNGITARGDARFIRLVMENLFDNAWKFTSLQQVPTIEFGAVHENGERAYFVKDDGAGFDSAYASKLFQPFQRLHSPKEFSGTGIGLASVQWIIRRHGGRVWAEGDPGKGATFFFTLPMKGIEHG
ncbi:MAG: ATP-binding protein, partial [Dehalococcoidia bacterium]